MIYLDIQIHDSQRTIGLTSLKVSIFFNLCSTMTKKLLIFFLHRNPDSTKKPKHDPNFDKSRHSNFKSLQSMLILDD